MGEYQLGALTVVQDTRDRAQINKRLKHIDERLFVELQLTFADEQVWCVVEDTGEQRGAERFVVVYEFRDANDRPIAHLTDAVVHEMQRRAREGTGNARVAGEIVRRRNRERLERLRADAQEQSEDIVRDFDRHGFRADGSGDGHFATLPRSPGLARARARAESTRVERLRAIHEAKRIARELSRAARGAA